MTPIHLRNVYFDTANKGDDVFRKVIAKLNKLGVKMHKDCNSYYEPQDIVRICKDNSGRYTYCTTWWMNARVNDWAEIDITNIIN